MELEVRGAGGDLQNSTVVDRALKIIVSGDYSRGEMLSLFDNKRKNKK